ncbi:hypothetical protein [Paracoccus aminovorans]|uniref:hypothetical protein n=1 Tax=Paracoccus aminovorans TaxID=34004 RepID=UPI002B25F8E9|nr:hypothetical protein [Paracoccus aminovorans]
MPFYVFGGSNSIFRDGWVSSFSQQTGQPVLNRSVGATTTLTGLFRFLMPGDGDQPGEGDCVLWEYALNEVNHVARGYRREMLLKNVEHLMALCRARGCRFVPLILTPLWQERAPQRDPYYQMLTDLFAHHGIVPFDVSVAWRQRNAGQRLPDALYTDSAHYTRAPELTAFIAAGVVDLVAASRVPAPVAPLHTAGRSVALVEGLAQGWHENALMRIPTAQLPLSIELNGHGRVAAVCALCHADFESGIRVQLQRDADQMRQMRFSTTNSSHRRIILKAVSLENALGKRWDTHWLFGPGDRLLLSPARHPGEFYAEHELRSTLTMPEQKTPARIAGVLLENVTPAC